MQESEAARDALLRFYEAFSRAAPGDKESFERVFTREPDLMIIGTAAHEWVEGREKGAKGVGKRGDPHRARRPARLGAGLRRVGS